MGRKKFEQDLEKKLKQFNEVTLPYLQAHVKEIAECGAFYEFRVKFNDSGVIAEKESALESMLSAAIVTKNPLFYYDCAVASLSLHRYDLFLICIEKTVRHAKELKIDFFKKVNKLRLQLEKVSAEFNANTKHPSDPLPHLRIAGIDFLEGNFVGGMQALAKARQLASQYHEKETETYLISALAHYYFGKPKAELWEKTAEFLSAEKSWERCGETRSFVRYYTSPFFANVFISKEKEDASALKGEKKMTEQIKAIVEEKYMAPDVFYVTNTKFDGRHALLMSRMQGKTLLELFKERNFRHLGDVIDCLALIHSKVSQKMLSKGKADLSGKLYDKLSAMNLPVSLSKNIWNNYNPVDFAHSKAVYVYNKDAHPENWLVSPSGKVIVLDCEDSSLVPLQHDLVNLLEYSPLLGDSIKEKALSYAVKKYSYLMNARLDENDFRRIYFNSVIDRAISLCGAWSADYRPSMHSERPVIILNGINAISRIKKEHSDYYRKFENNYIALAGALKELRNIVAQGKH